MNASRRCDCPHNEQAVGWALHVLEPDEEMAVLLHLPRCSSCQVAVLEAERVLASLGASIEQIDPPASLRHTLLARVAETPQHPLMLRPRTSPEAAPQPLPAEPPPSRHRRDVENDDAALPPSTAPAARPSWFSQRGRRLIAASVALIGVLTVAGLAVRTTQVAERVAETAQAQTQTLAEIITQLDEPGTAHATLATPDGAKLAAVVVHDGQRTLVTAGLAPNARERDTYVVWGTGDGAPRPIAVFDVGGTGPDVRSVGFASEADGFSGYAISLEPGRAAPASPSTVVARGQVET